MDKEFLNCQKEIGQRVRDIRMSLNKIREDVEKYFPTSPDVSPSIYDELATIEHHLEMMNFSFVEQVQREMNERDDLEMDGEREAE